MAILRINDGVLHLGLLSIWTCPSSGISKEHNVLEYKPIMFR
jgi:hypothetical protein